MPGSVASGTSYILFLKFSKLKVTKTCVVVSSETRLQLTIIFMFRMTLLL